MSQKRQLAAIMFTDIEGYTALMQGNEAQAIHFRQEHRNIFNSTTEKYGGKILQYYGDGTLSIFDSAIVAVECGIEMQRAFQSSTNPIAGKTGIPVRIGIHSGDIIYSKEDIIGNSVNIASRIESLACVGSVFISYKVFDEIKNQDGIETQSMGLFELKNVAKPVEVFAISNSGLIVPDPKQIQGKAKRVEVPDSFFTTLWGSGQAQLVTGYFVGIWGLVQFTDWVLNRYQISPHWVDALLVLFLSLIPSLIIYVWKLDRIKMGKINLLEKLFLPGNLLVSILLLFILFNGTDLGATTKTVHFNNENGAEESRTIVKPNFRKRLAIHTFTSEQKDSMHQWMNWGIHGGIAEDISQNGYLTIGFWQKAESLQEMIKLSDEDFYDHFLTGSYSVNDNVYYITTKLYNTHNGALQKTHSFSGIDFFALIDTISLITKKDLDFTQIQLDQFVDLPYAEAFTSDIEAYKNFSLYFFRNSLKHLEEAISLDSTFALANYVRAELLYGWSSSLLGAKEAINQGMRHRKRLPEKWESGLKRLYFQIYDEPDKAIALLKMQLEMDPGNENIIKTLTFYFFLTNRYDELLKWREQLVTIDPHPDNQMGVAEALLLNGRFEEAGEIIMKIRNQYPNLLDALTTQASYYALTGQVDKANTLLQKIIIKNPEVNPLAEHYLKSFQYTKDHPQTPERLLKYEGHYRLQDRAAEYDIHIIENLLYGKGRTHMTGFFFIPSDPDEFLMGGSKRLEKWKFISDTSGKVYKIDILGITREQQTFTNVLWRQDSLILRAVELFSFDKKAEALEAFKIAYNKNPQHFYLAQYIKHLEFVLEPNNKEALENMTKYMGSYGPRLFWMENDKVYYEREGQISKQRLLPVSKDMFYFWGGYQYLMQVVVENGEVKGSVSWEYDNTIGEFVHDENDYFEFDELKD